VAKIEISVRDLKTVVERLLKIRGIDTSSIELICEDYVGAEINGKPTHGVGKLLLLDDLISAAEGTPLIVKKDGAFCLLDGKKCLGQIVAALAIEAAAEIVSEHGVCVLGMTNFVRYGRLSVIGRALAERGWLAVVCNNAGPPAIVSPGSTMPVLGTNPICIALPGTPVTVVDLATSKKPWGEIRQAMLERRELPPDTFLDASGKFTVDPSQAESVVAFGGPKGFALALALELICGALLPAKTGRRAQTQFDLGAFIFVMRGDAFRPLDVQHNEIAALASDLAQAGATTPGSCTHMPGWNDVSLRTALAETRTVHLENDTFAALKTMAEGGRAPLSSDRKND
jgi:LDH2 family malate/lactate/ureidoglycolate dehydrogenase